MLRNRTPCLRMDTRVRFINSNGYKSPSLSRSLSLSPSLAGDFAVKNVVIGAGVVGLAVAASISRLGPTLVIERNSGIGQETSSRNSEVVHSGIYYPVDSLKTRLCIRGRELLYDTCKEGGIPFIKVGKWIVAQDDDEAQYLSKLHAKSKQLSIPTRFTTAEERAKLEPNVRAKEALLSPETGIVDSHGLMLHLQGKTQAKQGEVVTNTSVIAIERVNGGYSLTMQSTLKNSKKKNSSGAFLKDDGQSPAAVAEVFAENVINSAGLSSDSVARLLMKEKTPNEYKLHFVRGCYFGIEGSPPLVSRLVYPVPEANLVGIGIHATVDLSGRVRLGPDTEYIENVDYTVDDNRRDLFWREASRYLQSLRKEALFPDYAGVRPKLSSFGEGAKDFVVREESERGFPGFVNLIGIESPGLTSSLAIGEMVATILS